MVDCCLHAANLFYLDRVSLPPPTGACWCRYGSRKASGGVYLRRDKPGGSPAYPVLVLTECPAG